MGKKKKGKKGGEKKRAKRKGKKLSAKCVKKRLLWLFFVIVVAVIFDIGMWVVCKSEEFIKDVQGISIFICTILAGAFFKDVFFDNMWKKRTLKKFIKSVLEAGVAWMVLCILCGSSIIALGSEIKVRNIASQKQKNEDAAETEEETESVQLAIKRNHNPFDWSKKIYIEDLSEYYDGITRELTTEEEIYYKYHLVSEYIETTGIVAIQADNEKEFFGQYEMYTNEANEYYTLYKEASDKNYSEGIQKHQLELSKTMRENANMECTVSINMYLIGTNTRDLGIMELKDATTKMADVYENTLEWYIKSYRQAVGEIKYNLYGTNADDIQNIIKGIRESYQVLAKADVQNISQNADMMLHVLDYEGCDNKVDYLLGVQ